MTSTIEHHDLSSAVVATKGRHVAIHSPRRRRRYSWVVSTMVGICVLAFSSIPVRPANAFATTQQIFNTVSSVRSLPNLISRHMALQAEKSAPMSSHRRRTRMRQPPQQYSLSLVANRAAPICSEVESLSMRPSSTTALQGGSSRNSGNSDNSGGTTSKQQHGFNELEFEMHVGKAMDTLRKDYMDLLIRAPDYSIYNKHLEFVDPSGVRVHGIRSYQNAYRLLHTIVKFLYCPQKSAITSARMCYDPVKRNVRISWNAEVVPREIFGGTRSILHVDGISVYEFDRGSGEIVQHRLEYLIMNNKAVQPKEGLVAALQQYHGATVPSCCHVETESTQNLWNEQKDIFHVPFSVFKPNQGSTLFSKSPSSSSSAPSDNGSRSTLNSFEASRSDGDDAATSSVGGAGSSSSLEINWEAFESKNKSRKKFGLKPMTPEEFLNFETQVREMDAEQQIKRQQQAADKAARAAEEAKQSKKQNRLLDRLFSNVLKDTCETNFDCVRPEVCCDFGFKKMCCSSGSPVLGQQYATVPVPVEVADYPGQPPSRY